jgi:hypothetical protein
MTVVAKDVVIGSGGTYVVEVTTTTFPLDIVDVIVSTTILELRVVVLVESCASTPPGESLVVDLVNVPSKAS